jgi:hypothetical protein
MRASGGRCYPARQCRFDPSLREHAPAQPESGCTTPWLVGPRLGMVKTIPTVVRRPSRFRRDCCSLRRIREAARRRGCDGGLREAWGDARGVGCDVGRESTRDGDGGSREDVGDMRAAKQPIEATRADDEGWMRPGGTRRAREDQGGDQDRKGEEDGGAGGRGRR